MYQSTVPLNSKEQGFINKGGILTCKNCSKSQELCLCQKTANFQKDQAYYDASTTGGAMHTTKDKAHYEGMPTTGVSTGLGAHDTHFKETGAHHNDARFKDTGVQDGLYNETTGLHTTNLGTKIDASTKVVKHMEPAEIHKTVATAEVISHDKAPIIEQHHNAPITKEHH